MQARLETARIQVKQELYGALIRAQTDPVGVRSEALALEKLTLRLKSLLTA